MFILYKFPLYVKHSYTHTSHYLFTHLFLLTQLNKCTPALWLRFTSFPWRSVSGQLNSGCLFSDAFCEHWKVLGSKGCKWSPAVCACRELHAQSSLPLYFFSGSAQSFAQLLRAKWSPWEIIQLRQDVPEHPDYSSQAELRISAKRSWGMVEHGYSWRTWSKGHTSGGSEKDGWRASRSGRKSMLSRNKWKVKEALGFKLSIQQFKSRPEVG